MRLSGLTSLLAELPEFRQLLEAARNAEVPGVGVADRLPPSALHAVIREAAKPFVVAGLQAQSRRPLLIVASDGNRAQEWYQDLLTWTGDPERVLLFPGFDALPYEQLPSVPEVVTARVGTLIELSGDGISGASRDTPLAIVTSVHALLFGLAPPEEFGHRVLSLRKGRQFNLNTLVHHLSANGYERAGLVEVPGSFSQRGGIVDVFPPLAESPVRLEFFGDEIESIRSFDPSTQRSAVEMDHFLLAPATEFALWRGAEAAEQLRALDWSALRQEVREEWDWQVRDLEAGAFFSELPFYAAYLAPQPATLLDYVPDALVLLDEPESIVNALADLHDQAAELQTKLTASGSVPPSFRSPYVARAALLERLAHTPTLHMSYRPAEVGADSLEFTSFEMAPTYGGRIKDVVDETRKRQGNRQRVVMVTLQASRLAELYADRGVTLRNREALEEAPDRGTLIAVHGQLGEGWSNPALGVFLLTDTEIFGWAKPRRVIRRRRVARESFLSELKPGDFVVHMEHGIAQYQGLVKRKAADGEREYLLLQFQANDRVYVPTDQLDRVDRYIGVGDHTPALSKLGGGEWPRAKARVKQSAAESAKDLLELYSAREMAKAEPLPPDNEWQREVEESFPYVETPDQLLAIADVKADLEKEKPMDRLVVGDVGFGKTEVALRAAFKAVQDGKQVAVLVPTTVLALQHFRTFKERVQAYPLTVELLSRFRTPKEQEEVVAGLASGAVDIVVGTHRLLGKDIKFKDLGLLVIDEEHRFGVMHKERIKQLRVNVHVLTLTATPIPRTLHTSLVGLRDMSVIETPPEARLPIKTYVTGTNDDLIREAILREIDRGGQVFYVHNRVQSIYQVTKKLQRLVPEADFTIGHGQMNEDDLEKVMLEFAQGSHDVLVCTTIIESGLDIPNANTIIVADAGNFGLAQLYQLRGRVGRGGNQAYAYLLYEPNRRLTETAEKRLRTIFEANDLGAGFKIAMKDLEIRGAGNLLGPEQSGFMNTVGFDLYMRLLAEAVDELRGKRTVPEFELVLDLPLGANLPDDYVGDADLKLRLYRRLADLTTEAEVDEVQQEFGDRFGPLPQPVQDLFYLLRVKILAKARFLRGIETQGGELVLKTSPFVVSDRLALYKAFGTSAVVRSGAIRIPRLPDPRRWKEDLLKVLNTLRVVEVARTPGAAPSTPSPEPAAVAG
ncbi:MAG TPA: transcription-repair coupling factor [Chloroflexota bacterium]|nr:transcription-repair coupling factor [Chloroflexota bacterium]